MRCEETIRRYRPRTQCCFFIVNLQNCLYVIYKIFVVKNIETLVMAKQHYLTQECLQFKTFSVVVSNKNIKFKLKCNLKLKINHIDTLFNLDKTY